MKKLSAIFIAVIMMLTVVSCISIPKAPKAPEAPPVEIPKVPEAPESPEHEASGAYEKYMHISKVLEDAGSIGADTYLKISANDGDETIIMEMYGPTGAVAPNKPEMEMDSQLLVNVSFDSGRNNTGWQHVYLAYYKDGYLYTHFLEMVTMNESKQKTRVPADEATRRINLFGPFFFTESAIMEMSESEAADEPYNEFDADEGTILRFVLNASEIDGILYATAQSKMADLLGGSENGGSYQTFNFGDSTLTVLLNKYGGLANMNMSFPFEVVTEDGMHATAEIEMHMTMKQVGDVTISFPDDLESYEQSDDIADYDVPGGDDPNGDIPADHERDDGTYEV